MTSAATRVASATRSCQNTATCGPATWWSAPTATPPAMARCGAFSFGIGATEMACVWTLGRGPERRSPATIKVVVRRASSTPRRPQGSDPAPDREADRRGRELQGARISRPHHPEDVHLRPAGHLQHVASRPAPRAGIVPADEETIRYLQEEAGVTGHDRCGDAGRRCGLRSR